MFCVQINVGQIINIRIITPLFIENWARERDMYWRKHGCDRSLFDNNFNNYFNDWLPNCKHETILVELLAGITSLNFTMLSLQNAMETIGFNSNSESRKQLCCSVKLQNCSYFTRFCKLLQDKATTFWKWGYEIGVLQWGTWTAREPDSWHGSF